MANIRMESSEQEFVELQRKRQQEIIEAQKQVWAETAQKVRKLKIRYLITTFILQVLGLVIVGFAANIWLAIGLFVFAWGQNMGLMIKIWEDQDNIWKHIWRFGK